jgi:hypothetical protein
VDLSLSLSQFFVSYVSRLRKFLQKELVIYLLFSIPASNNATLPTGEKEVQISLGGLILKKLIFLPCYL